MLARRWLAKWLVLVTTLPEIENPWLEDEFHFQMTYGPIFRDYVSFREVMNGYDRNLPMEKVCVYPQYPLRGGPSKIFEICVTKNLGR